MEKHLHEGAKGRINPYYFFKNFRKKTSKSTNNLNYYPNLIIVEKTQIYLPATITCKTVDFVSMLCIHLKPVSGLAHPLTSRNPELLYRGDRWAGRKGFMLHIWTVYKETPKFLHTNVLSDTVKSCLSIFLGLSLRLNVPEKVILKGKKYTTCHAISKYTDLWTSLLLRQGKTGDASVSKKEEMV